MLNINTFYQNYLFFFKKICLYCYVTGTRYEELHFLNLANVVLTENHSAEQLPYTSDGKIKQSVIH
jgi:hypothetical protein